MVLDADEKGVEELAGEVVEFLELNGYLSL